MTQREIALNILYKTIKNNSYSNLLMRKELEQLPQIQRAFVTNLVNGVLRKYEILNYQFSEYIKTNTNFKIKLILALATYERFYLNESDYVVNNEYVKLASSKFEKAFVNAVLRKMTNFKQSENQSTNACIPEWIYKLLSKQYDTNDLNKIINVYQTIPSLYYRLNKKKANYEMLNKLQINVLNDDLFTSNLNLINSTEYQKGYFYIQDFNSASLYKHLDLEKSNTLLDVCSAPGSKLFNCLDILDPKNCYANDLHLKRVNLIEKMAQKLGYEGINYLNEDGTLLKDKLTIKFDRILLDAPCSGLGVISRKPDLKFHISPNNLDELEKLQFNLLNSVSKLLKTNGILLYSTCTLNIKENSKQIAKFLSENKDFVLLEENTIINDLGDCFYYGKVKKI